VSDLHISSVEVGTNPQAIDRTSDLGVAIVHMNGQGDYWPSVHIKDATEARALAAAFTQAAEYLETAGKRLEAGLCEKCERLLTRHPYPDCDVAGPANSGGAA
jgi:hypothetical protein